MMIPDMIPEQNHDTSYISHDPSKRGIMCETFRFHDTEKDRDTSQVSHDSTNVSSMKPVGTMIAAKILTVLMVLLSFTDFSCISPRFLDWAFSTCCPPIGVKFIDASFGVKFIDASFLS
uniref:Uncharacterized protein n=1 Tax=Oryza nivara TaxID=4536 RepID=A0A0E0IYD3_ORYNI